MRAFANRRTAARAPLDPATAAATVGARCVGP